MAEAWEDPGRSDEDHTDPNDHTRGRILTALPARSDAGFRRGDDGELVPHEAEQKAIREMAGLRAQGKSLTAIADAMRRTANYTENTETAFRPPYLSILREV